MKERKSRRRRRPPASQIRAALRTAYKRRQHAWAALLASDQLDWTALLSLHLQMVELETMLEKLEER